MGEDVVDFRLADAEALHADHPRSFFIPARTEREGLGPGDVAKLLFELVDPGKDDPGAERMWVRVERRDGAGFVGTLENVPAVITTIAQGDLVRFGPEHVIAVPDGWPLLGLQVFVSRRSHEHDLRPGFVYREDPDHERDSGWRALVGDETEAEVDDPGNILVQQLGYLLDRWPELRPVLETDPQHGAWAWDGTAERYVRLHDEP